MTAALAHLGLAEFATVVVALLERDDVACTLHVARAVVAGCDAQAAAVAPRAAGDETERLRAEIAELKAALAKAQDAARKRANRRVASAAAAQMSLPDVRPDVSDVSPDVSDAPMHASSSSSSSNMMIAGNARGRVTQDADHPPEWAIAAWSELRPDLAEYEFRGVLWPWFAKRPHRDDDDARDHFRRVLPKHKAGHVRPAIAATPAPALPTPVATPPPAPASSPQPKRPPPAKQPPPVKERPKIEVPVDFAAAFSSGREVLEKRLARTQASAPRSPPEPKSMSA